MRCMRWCSRRLSAARMHGACGRPSVMEEDMRTHTKLSIALAAMLCLASPAITPAGALAQEEDPVAPAVVGESSGSTEIWIRGPRPARTTSTSGEQDGDPASKPSGSGKTDDPSQARRDLTTSDDSAPSSSGSSWGTSRESLARTGDVTRWRLVGALVCGGSALVLLSRMVAGHATKEACDA